MEYNNTVKKQPDGYYYFPRIKQYPYKTKNLRDYWAYILLIQKKYPDVANELLERFGYVNRDDGGKSSRKL